MEGDTTKHVEKNSPQAGNPLAEPGGKEQGGEAGSEVYPSNGVENSDKSTTSAKTNDEQQQQQQQSQSAVVSAGQSQSTPQSPRTFSNSPKIKARGLRANNNPTGQTDPTMPSVIHTGILPPLNVRGKDRQRRHSHDENSKPGQDSLSFRGAAVTVVSAGVLKEYRRSSAAMHIELLRVFVPDMLIKVSAMRALRTYRIPTRIDEKVWDDGSAGNSPTIMCL